MMRGRLTRLGHVQSYGNRLSLFVSANALHLNSDSVGGGGGGVRIYIWTNCYDWIVDAVELNRVRDTTQTSR